jgi:hypothetical protein
MYQYLLLNMDRVPQVSYLIMKIMFFFSSLCAFRMVKAKMQNLDGRKTSGEPEANASSNIIVD